MTTSSEEMSVAAAGSNFFVKTLRDGGCRLEIDISPEDAPELMAFCSVFNNDQRNNQSNYQIKIQRNEGKEHEALAPVGSSEGEPNL